MDAYILEAKEFKKAHDACLETGLRAGYVDANTIAVCAESALREYRKARTP